MKALRYLLLFLLLTVATAHGAITHQTDGAVAAAGDGDITIVLPSNSAGDLLVCTTAIRGNNGATPTMTGYTNLGSIETDTTIRLFIWGKISSGSESNPVFDVNTDGSGNDTVLGQCSAFRGTLNTTTGIVAHSTCQQQSGTQDIAYGNLTITTPNTLVITAAMKADDWTSVAQLSGYTEFIDGFSVLGSDAGIVADYQIQTTATNVTGSNFTVTGGVSQGSASCSISLKPDAAAPTYTVDPAFSARTSTSTSATATLSANSATTTRYGVLVVDGSGAPTCTQVKAGQNSSGSAAVKSSSGVITDAVQHTLTMSSMTSGATYDWYECANNSVGDTVVKALADQYKTPVLSSATLNARTTSSITLRLNGDTIGTGYCIAADDGSGTPTAAQIEAGTQNGGGAAYKSGNVTMSAEATNYDIALSTYTNGTVRDGYCATKKSGTSTYSAVVAIADMYKIPAFTTPLTVASQDTTSYTSNSKVLDGAGTVNWVSCHKGATPPTVAQTNARTGGCVLFGSTDDATGTQTLTITGTPDPVYDLYYTGTYGSQVEAAVTSIVDSSTCLDPPVGRQYIGCRNGLTSILAGSFCEDFNAVATPDIAIGDIILMDSTTTPSAFGITAGVDCSLIYGPPADGTRQLIKYDVWDLSASGYHAQTLNELWINNTTPIIVDPGESIFFAVPLNSASTPHDFLQYAFDGDGDALVVSGASPPTGLSFTTGALGGTATVQGIVTDTATWTDIAGATVSKAYTVIVGNVVVPDCDDGDVTFSDCQDLLLAQYLGDGDLTFEYSVSVPAGNVISQSEAAGSQLPPGSTVDLVISRGEQGKGYLYKRLKLELDISRRGTDDARTQMFADLDYVRPARSLGWRRGGGYSHSLLRLGSERQRRVVHHQRRGEVRRLRPDVHDWGGGRVRVAGRD